MASCGSLCLFLTSENRTALNVHWKSTVVNHKDMNEAFSLGRQSRLERSLIGCGFPVQEDHCECSDRPRWC